MGAHQGQGRMQNVKGKMQNGILTLAFYIFPFAFLGVPSVPVAG
jgi:hypothetical protein